MVYFKDNCNRQLKENYYSNRKLLLRPKRGSPTVKSPVTNRFRISKMPLIEKHSAFCDGAFIVDDTSNVLRCISVI